MSLPNQSDREAERLLGEYARREAVLPRDRYAAWQPAELFMRQGRERRAVQLLKRVDRFPKPGDDCMEVGYGRLGWLATLLGWGLRSEDLYGVELDPTRAEEARLAFPASHLEVGDATSMAWADGTFRLIVASTVFSSILDHGVRRALAREMTRVLASDGAIVWYDFRVDNPANPHVKGIGSREIRTLFPDLEADSRSVTLVPPLARRVISLSWTAAAILEALPFLRSHLLTVLVRPSEAEEVQSA